MLERRQARAYSSKQQLASIHRIIKTKSVATIIIVVIIVIIILSIIIIIIATTIAAIYTTTTWLKLAVIHGKNVPGKKNAIYAVCSNNLAANLHIVLDKTKEM